MIFQTVKANSLECKCKKLHTSSESASFWQSSSALGLEWLTDRVPGDQWSRSGDRLETGDNWAEQDVVWHHGRPGGFRTNPCLPSGVRLGNDYLKHSPGTGSFGKLRQSVSL